MAILNNSNAISSGGYDINNSLRFRSSASASLTRTPASAGNRKTWTWSGWVKRGTLSATQGIFSANTDDNNKFFAQFNSNNTFEVLANSGGGTVVLQLTTSAVYRDPSAWYHIVVALDTTQATSSNRAKVYVNGSQVTAFGTATYPSQNTDINYNQAASTSIGSQLQQSGGTSLFDGYLAETHFIDGSAKTPSDFGETDTTTGSWKPKAYTGTYGTNGFYLKFSDIATTSGSNAGLGKDFSGNANYWNTSGISVTAGTTYDAMIDSPTLTSATVANYATFNLLNNTGGSKTFAEGNLKVTGGGAAVNSTEYPTFQLPSGKWYFEGTVGAVGAASITGIGTSDFFYQADGSVYPSGSVASFTTNDVIGVAIDVDAGTVQFYKNGVSQITKTGTAGATVLPAFALGGSATAPIWYANFGQRPFSYTPPTGFNRLNTFNLPDSTIKKGNTVMDATLYTGNGTARSITNAGSFKPDLVWIKDRSTAAYSHVLYDSIRGIYKYLVSNDTAAEVNATGSLTAFNSNGFSLGTDAYINGSSDSFVGWQWQAGQGTTSSNTSGSITSTVSVNTTAGFSVVTYTGTGSTATIGHGLGVAPKMIICKSRSATGGWNTYHADLGNTKGIYLNLTQATTTSANFWNNTSPTSTVFTLSGANETNTNGSTNVAYCWAEIAGFSKFTSYTGNGSTDGPFIFLGFRPKFVMVKYSSGVDSWFMFDTSREDYNVMDLRLEANTSNSEASVTAFADFLSNGFKIRSSSSAFNANGGTYIVAAWAENPFRNSLAR
jgi:hypothetical protein